MKTSTATITYEELGVRHEWAIGAVSASYGGIPPDNEESLKAHLAKWRPNAKWIGFRWEGVHEVQV